MIYENHGLQNYMQEDTKKKALLNLQHIHQIKLHLITM